MQTLKDENFIVMNNHFSDDYYTRYSLNSLLAIDQSLWKLNKKDYFAGRDNSPLFDLLKLNDYRIITGYHDSHFGPSGKYVDEYLTFRSIKVKNKNYKKYYVNYCQFKMPWYHLQMFNYCEILKLFFNIDDTEKLNSKKDFEKYINSFIDLDEQNKFVIFHQLTHSHPTHSTKDWAQDFYDARLMNVELIKFLSSKIRQNDPNSILIILGDHGPSLLKMSSEKKFHTNIFKTYNGNETLAYFMDTFSTVGAVLDNSQLCYEDLNILQKQNYTTNSMILNTILKCMLNVKQLTNYDLEYSIPGYKNTPIDKDTSFKSLIKLIK